MAKKSKREKSALKGSSGKKCELVECDSTEATTKGDAAESETKGDGNATDKKYQLVRVKLEQIVRHHGEFLIAIPAEHLDYAAEAVEAVELEYGFDEFIEFDELDGTDLPVELVAIDPIEGNPETADLKVEATLNEYDEVEMNLMRWGRNCF